MSTPALRAAATATVGGRLLTLELDVAEGEVVALVGPNGAGKSVTLEVLVGLRAVADGTITAGDRVLVDTAAGTDLPAHRRGLGWVPQAPSLLPRRSTVQQVRAFADPSRAPLLRSRTVDDLLESLLLGHLRSVRPPALSGGQAQRVAVARALAHSSVVLFDEATSAQDPDGARAIREAIRAHGTDGGSALVVAHRPEDAWALADRAVVLESLTPVQVGDPRALASRPATAYVAQVAGATVLRGHVDDRHVLHTDRGELVVGDQVATGPVVALIRPGAVTLHHSRPEGLSARNLIESTVVAIEHSSGGLRVVLDGRPPVTAALTEEAAATLELRPGLRVWAACKASDVEVRPA